MLPNERISYSAIQDRPRLVLPDGARLVVWVIVNVEEWNPRETMPRTVLTPPAGGSPMPDIPNWAWHEYGNRIGFWRMLEVLDRFRIRAVLAIRQQPARFICCVGKKQEPNRNPGRLEPCVDFFSPAQGTCVPTRYLLNPVVARASRRPSRSTR